MKQWPNDRWVMEGGIITASPPPLFPSSGDVDRGELKLSLKEMWVVLGGMGRELADDGWERW